MVYIRHPGVGKSVSNVCCQDVTACLRRRRRLQHIAYQPGASLAARSRLQRGWSAPSQVASPVGSVGAWEFLENDGNSLPKYMASDFRRPSSTSRQ